MEAYIVWGFVIVLNKKAASHEFKWIDKNSQGFREVKFYLLTFVIYTQEQNKYGNF